MIHQNTRQMQKLKDMEIGLIPFVNALLEGFFSLIGLIDFYCCQRNLEQIYKLMGNENYYWAINFH
ncbi:hypothetical protein SAMN04488097_3569 [Epilithonimonas lactis]|nr:hypothetical protein SAMN04488097_3569 [Epilithonimonas lactis]